MHTFNIDQKKAKGLQLVLTKVNGERSVMIIIKGILGIPVTGIDTGIPETRQVGAFDCEFENNKSGTPITL